MSENSRIYLQDVIQRADLDLRSATIEYDSRMADTLSSTLLRHWTSEDDCDLILRIDHRQYYVHSSLLFSVCRSLENRVETTNSSAKIKYIGRLTRIASAGLELLLIYFYTSRLILTVPTIVDLIRAASELQVEFVIQRCISFVHRFLLDLHSEHEDVRSPSKVRRRFSSPYCSS